MAIQGKELNKTAALTALQNIGSLPVNKLSADNIAAISNLLSFANDGFLEYHFESEGDVDFSLPLDISDNDAIQTIITAFPQAATVIGKLISSTETFNPRNVENIWLEFDTSSPDFKGIPSLYFDLHRAHYLYLNYSYNSEIFWKSWLNESIAVIGTKNYIPENISAMQHCINQLSTAGFPAYVGIMKGRDEQLRLSLKMLDNSMLINFLTAVGLQLSQDIEQKITNLVSLADIVAVNLDFENGSVGRPFGIELHVSKNEEHGVHEDNLFNALLSYSLCTPQQKEQVLAWPNTKEDDTGVTSLQRLSHVKIALTPEKIDCAKAYLYYLYNTTN